MQPKRNRLWLRDSIPEPFEIPGAVQIKATRVATTSPSRPRVMASSSPACLMP